MLDPREEPGEEQVALLVIKVGAGNLERGKIAKAAVSAKVAERERVGGVLAISEMAVKINEWKSSPSSSARCPGYSRPNGERAPAARCSR